MSIISCGSLEACMWDTPPRNFVLARACAMCRFCVYSHIRCEFALMLHAQVSYGMAYNNRPFVMTPGKLQLSSYLIVDRFIQPVSSISSVHLRFLQSTKSY
jgi:hypothetical protein